jgi:hypothetical protein
MKKTLTLAGVVILVGGGAATYLFVSKPSHVPAQQVVASAAEPYVVPVLENHYTNDTYHFSVEMPAQFSAQEEDDATSKTILLQDESGNGIQILVSPYDSSVKTLTADDIRASIPDLHIRDDQVLEIGDDYRGVAFKSDNEAFGGDSREVWFVFRGNLYQISTYARLDGLLKAMFATWKFF